MPCYKPLKGYRARAVNSETGRTPIVFNIRYGDQDQPIDLPCGQCIGCRLERSRQWAIRCLHEAKMHSQNCFITLTYSSEYLPRGSCLKFEDFQLFMKRLRKKFGSGIRFFHCGEYGEKYSRPHYHACIFNHDFHDKTPWKKINGNQYYQSKDLEELWPQGFSSITELNFETAAYAARYITKKITGKAATSAYHYFDPIISGPLLRPREYTTMSRRPGIGKKFYEAFKSDVFPLDLCVVRGKEMKPPKYYDTQYEHDDPQGHALMKFERKQAALTHSMEHTDRISIREIVHEAKFAQLKRNYENET